MIIINNSNTQVKDLILSCQYNLPKNEEKLCLLLEDFFWGKAKQMSTVMLSGYMCTCGSLVYKWISIGADVGGTHCNGDWETIRVTSIYIQNLTS